MAEQSLGRVQNLESRYLPAWVPLWMPLGSNSVHPERLWDTLSRWSEPWSEEEINELRSRYQILLIADGYDEMLGSRTINLYDANDLGRYQGRVKILISSRLEEHAAEESTYFVPHRSDGRLNWSLYKECYLATFDKSQRADYIQQYLEKHSGRSESALWPDAATYERHMVAIPGLELLMHAFCADDGSGSLT